LVSQRFPEAAIARGQQNVLLGLEIVEEGPARDAGGLRDRVERRGFVAVLHEQFQTLFDDPLGRLPPLAFPQALRPFRRAFHVNMLRRRPLA
jgi:hypothetical protein